MMMTGFLTPRRRRSFLINDEGSTSKESISDTSSINVLASPLQAYKYENNRRYHAYREGSYWGPNDEQDAFHQKVTHHLFTLMLQDRLYLAPVPRPRQVLDIGTGIGLWASNMADAHPTAQILGIDLSPTWQDAVRPNLSLEVDDCCSNWTYIDEGRDLFDLIHIRCMYGSIKDWKKLYQQAFDHLERGSGYIEQAELSLIPHFYYATTATTKTKTPTTTTTIIGVGEEDSHLSHGRHINRVEDASTNSVFLDWYNFWQECSEKTGKTWLIADDMADLIYDIGFENVREVRYMLPLFDSSATTACEYNDDHDNDEEEYEKDLVLGGGYPDYPISRLRDIKKWFRQFWETGMEGWVLAISTRFMGWTADEAKQFVAQTKKVLAEHGNRVYYEMVIVYGQRPRLEGEE